ncbi:MAG: MerR family transcriptional regulator [Clostridia bacterium]|nr:MerR family transcriptional regulator [Clostridia bacterium]
MDREKKACMTRAEFCRRVGITQETLRHYVDRGLIRPAKHEQNRYQLYSLGDAAVAFGIREMRSMNLPLDDIEREMTHEGLQGFAHSVSLREKRLLMRQQEIERELAQIQYQRSVCDAYLTDEGRKPRLGYYSPSISAYYDGTPQAAQRVKALAERFPYSYGVIKLPLVPVPSGLPYQLGMLLPEQAIPKADGLDVSQFQPCARMRVCAGFDVPDFSMVRAQDFMSVVYYAQKHNYRTDDEIILVVHHVYRRGDVIGGVVSAGVGVEEND